MEVDHSKYVNNMKCTDSVSPETIEVNSSKSILSYQNGSTSKLDCLEKENESSQIYDQAEDDKSNNTKEEEEKIHHGEILDVVRKKLISDLILDVFSNDLEKELVNVELLSVPKETQSLIQRLVLQITQLSDTERLLLYLKLPSTKTPFDPLRQPLNPLGNRQEIQQTIVWIKTHLEEDQDISIPKQDVYDQYLKFCMNASMKPLSTADFGKVMKQVYPGVRPRRLGTRGNSRYCYSGMRNTCKLPTPAVPSLLPANKQDSELMSKSTTVKTSMKNIEKSKRKWKSANRGKVGNFSSVQKKLDLVKANKRSKIESNETSPTDNNSRVFLESDVKNENSSNSFDTFENLNNDLGGEFPEGLGIYFDNITGTIDSEKLSNDTRDKLNHLDDNCGRTKPGDNEIETESKKSTGEEKVLKEPPALLPYKWCPGPTMKVYPKSPQTQGTNKKLKVELSSLDKNVENLKNEMEKTNKSANKVKDINSKTHINNVNLTMLTKSQENEEFNLNNQKTITKVQRRHSFSKGTKLEKNFTAKKTYVRIQPKPEPSLSRINFDVKLNVKQQMNNVRMNDAKQQVMLQDSMDSYLHGDESNSQEQEEEIVKYFQHLDDTTLVENDNANNLSNNFINTQVLKHAFINNQNINNNCTIKFNDKSEMITDVNAPLSVYTRSQSCMEIANTMFPAQLVNTDTQSFGPSVRSQSSLDFSASNFQYEKIQDTTQIQPSQFFQIENSNEKISQLRLLLEKSIPVNETVYSVVKEEPITKLDMMNTSEEVNMGSLVNNVNLKSDNCSKSNHSTNISSLNYTQEQTNNLLHKSDSLKPQPLHIPQSPNTRTKYFSFTPISPGPHSPLKTPSTPSASPFVSPRNTPIPRSRQNSSHSTSTPLNLHSTHDHFIYPSDRNSTKTFSNGCSKVGLQDCKKFVEEQNEKGSKIEEVVNTLQNVQKIENDSLWLNNDVRSFRPRSYSTTNFEKTEVRKNLLKMLSHNINKPSSEAKITNENNKVQENVNVYNNYNVNDPLANEVKNFFQNNDNTVQVQNSSFRSHSAPLRRMTRNNSWIANQYQISPTYSQYVNMDNICQNSMNPTPVPSEFCDFVNNTCDIVLECQNDSLYPTSDSVNINTKLFDEENNTTNIFNVDEDINFTNSQNDDASTTFQNNSCSFQDEGDNLISDDIKSFLPSFDNLPVKIDCEKSSKLFKRDDYVDVGENKKDPIITSFKPVLLSDSFPNSPVTSLFGAKLNQDNSSTCDYLKSANIDIISTENILNDDTDVFVGGNCNNHFSNTLSNGFIVNAKGYD